MKWTVPIAVTLVLVAMMMSPNIAHAQFLTTAPNMPGDRGLDSALGSGHVLDGGTQFLINVAAHSRSHLHFNFSKITHAPVLSITTHNIFSFCTVTANFHILILNV